MARQTEACRPARPLADKLGIKPDMRVCVIGVAAAEVIAPVRERAAAIVTGTVEPGASCVLFGVTERGQLAGLTAIRDVMARNGMIWVAWPKGRKELNENHVRAAALTQGLVDVKVAALSDVLSGLKLVIRLSDR